MIIDNKFNVDLFKLLSGASIHIPSIGITIYQPKLYEIAEIGEKNFYNFLSFFRINKDSIISNIKDHETLYLLENCGDYELLIILMQNEPEIEIGIRTILNLIIKDLKNIKFNENFIFLSTNTGQQYIIDNNSFLMIKDIIYQIFNLEDSTKEFNPANKMASDITNKIMERRKKLDELKGKKEQSIFADFVSILAIGLSCPDVSKILNLTVYQIFNLIKRFNMYSQYNIQIQALVQGAENIELIDWSKTI